MFGSLRLQGYSWYQVFLTLAPVSRAGPQALVLGESKSLVSTYEGDLMLWHVACLLKGLEYSARLSLRGLFFGRGFSWALACP